MIHQMLREEGWAKWPRRRQGERERQGLPERAAPATIEAVDGNRWQSVETAAGGGLVWVPMLVAWEFDPWSQRAPWPASTPIPAVNRLLARRALKVTGHARLSPVMDGCTDPGLSLFAALHTLPKTTPLSP